MNQFSFDKSALRVAKAKAQGLIHPAVTKLLWIISGLLLLAAIPLVLTRNHIGFSVAGIAVILITTLIWMSRDLAVLRPVLAISSTKLEDLLPVTLVAAYRPNMTAAEFWSMLSAANQVQFVLVRFGLMINEVSSALGSWPLNHDQLWAETKRLSGTLELPYLTEGAVLDALFHLCPALGTLLTTNKLTLEDMDEGAHWIARLELNQAVKRPIYGGIARDWASGFTPTLAHFGTNLSQQVEFAGKYFHTMERISQLDALVTGLTSANGSVVLVGDPGIGKSALLLGLADRLLQGKNSGSLAHHQIMSLSASLILSGAEAPGDIERVVLQLFGEAVHAGNIVIALDEAQLFFGQGTGAVNLSQVLLPILQSRRLKIVLSITPGDWQRLRAMNSSMASLLTPLVLAEPNEQEVMRVLADRSLLLEHDKITTWRALVEAYRLSSRYFEDEAYPGRALKLLEAAQNYPDDIFISDRSVQQAIESQFGVKVQKAEAGESEVLLHLEDKIHERMINQTRAVSVVSNALRRARAGVSNPKRPIGSFLFLGPTGVGKTELAKSLAALYFGAEDNIIRLDMSEYQQVPDANRILQSAAENPAGLLPKVRQTPFSVVLFDEIEKAHPNILNLLLQLLDEGNLTDSAGHATSFKDAIVIATSNAGADEIRKHIEAGEQLETFEQQFTNNLINSGAFKPELLNRFDEIVLFRPLNKAELSQVVTLMVAEVNKTLFTQKISVELAPDAVAELVTAGYDPRLGARPMRRMVQRKVEDQIATMILSGEAHAGDHIVLDAAHLAASSTSVGETTAEAPAPAAVPAASTTTPPGMPSAAKPEAEDQTPNQKP
jgi:ATP-dependent Clp protease ATP-binding subunit ClpC